MEERKHIIFSLKSNYRANNKGIEKRIKYLNIMVKLNLILTLFSAGVILATIILEPFDFDLFRWKKMGLLTILSLSFILGLPDEIFELKLLKHLKRITDKKDFIGVNKLNLELKQIINNLNNKLNNNRFIIPLALIIMVFGFVQEFFEDLNPYWSYIKIPVLLFYGIIISKFIVINKKLNYNIEKTEKHYNY